MLQNQNTKAFTLAEVLITLAIIGVVAALTIPSVVANTQQQEFKTGLKKAVSVLNSAITMNMAIDGETPYENKNLYYYLQKHMSVLKAGVVTPTALGESFPNISFYTTDGMRFEVPYLHHAFKGTMKLYENNDIALRAGVGGYGTISPDGSVSYIVDNHSSEEAGLTAHCGSYGLTHNDDNTVNPPCLVVVDVNGDRKPFPKNASCFGARVACSSTNIRKYADSNGRKLTDTFSIMITDKQAIPYGVAAQKAMYEAQK